jgi:hypothetical protein
MSDRIIQFRENQRQTVRGLSYNLTSREFLLDMEEGEAMKVTLDFTPLMSSGETLSVSVSDASGITATATESSGIVTLSLSALSSVGTVKLTATFSGGMVKLIRLRAKTRNSKSPLYDYNTGAGLV